jgi:hypothetical protein
VNRSGCRPCLRSGGLPGRPNGIDGALELTAIRGRLGRCVRYPTSRQCPVECRPEGVSADASNCCPPVAVLDIRARGDSPGPITNNSRANLGSARLRDRPSCGLSGIGLLTRTRRRAVPEDKHCQHKKFCSPTRGRYERRDCRKKKDQHQRSCGNNTAEVRGDEVVYVGHMCLVVRVKSRCAALTSRL